MRILIILYCLVMHLTSCSQKKDNLFVERIFSDYSRSSYYILINIESSGKPLPYLIENDDLFYYYHQQKGYNEKQYQEFIKPLINEGKSITVSASDINKYGFIIVHPNNKMREEIKKGKIFLLKKYFENRVLKEGTAIEDRNIIISALFNWNIASKIDDESGYLIYHE